MTDPLSKITPKHPTVGRKRVGEPVVHLGRGDRVVCAWALDGDFGVSDPEQVTCAYCRRIIREKSNA